AADPADLTAAFGPLEYGAEATVGAAQVPYQEAFGAVAPGEPLLWIDSSGALGLAVNQGSAARLFGLDAGGTIQITTTCHGTEHTPDRNPSRSLSRNLCKDSDGSSFHVPRPRRGRRTRRRGGGLRPG